MKKTSIQFLNLHLGRLCITSMTLILSVLSGCKSNEPSSTDESSMPSNEFHSETGMYVGITGFGENVSFYRGVSDRYNILSEPTIGGFTNFVNNLEMTDATVLYYAVDNNLDYLTKCQFPGDLSSVNIVTFTDGLNQGSRALDKQDGNHDYASNDKDYVNAVNDKLKTRTVQGHSINAYTIGIRGKDVQGDAVSTFKDNLIKLSSSPENATEVADMKELNDKFTEIAKSLYKKNSISSMSIVIPMPSDGESERFTFDDVLDASASKCYLEGVYEGGSLSNIVYVGCSSTAGDRVAETSAGGVKISFEFPSLVDDTGDAVSSKKMQQWHKSNGSSTWVRNSEFKPQESTTINVERKSAVIMLILDCSSSLGSDFAKVKESAITFLKTLVTGSGDDGSGSGSNIPSESVTDICGNTYRFVKIGNQYWLSENMRCNKYDTRSGLYGTTLSTSSSSTYEPYYLDASDKNNWKSTKYAGQLTNEQIDKLGFLYNWAAAVGFATAYEALKQKSNFSISRQGICPNGWHIPSSVEWNALKSAVGTNTALRLKSRAGWYSSNGTDAVSFAALPAGWIDKNSIIDTGDLAVFWTATPTTNSNDAYGRQLGDISSSLDDVKKLRSCGMAVRCVYD